MLVFTESDVGGLKDGEERIIGGERS